MPMPMMGNMPFALNDQRVIGNPMMDMNKQQGMDPAQLLALARMLNRQNQRPQGMSTPAMGPSMGMGYGRSNY